jgi:hypothetical protein
MRRSTSHSLFRPVWCDLGNVQLPGEELTVPRKAHMRTERWCVDHDLSLITHEKRRDCDDMAAKGPRQSRLETKWGNRNKSSQVIWIKVSPMCSWTNGPDRFDITRSDLKHAMSASSANLFALNLRAWSVFRVKSPLELRVINSTSSCYRSVEQEINWLKWEINRVVSSCQPCALGSRVCFMSQ